MAFVYTHLYHIFTSVCHAVWPSPTSATLSAVTNCFSLQHIHLFLPCALTNTCSTKVVHLQRIVKQHERPTDLLEPCYLFRPFAMCYNEIRLVNRSLPVQL